MESFIMAHHLRELVRNMVRSLGILEKNEVSCCGVTISQCHALVEIGRAKEISLNELAKQLNLDNSTMSRTVNHLVQQGMVHREMDEGDRRYVKIKLTETGDKIFREIEESMTLYYQNILESLQEDQREQVIESLELLVAAIKKNKCCQEKGE